jgi:uncharacterized protein YjdB
MKKMIVVFIALLCTFSFESKLVRASGTNPVNETKKASSRIIIKYKDSNGRLKKNTSGVKSIKNINDKFSVIETNSDSDREKLYNKLKSDSNVESVEKDKVLKLEDIPNDIYYSQQWYIQNIDVPKVWNSNIAARKAVTVAVIDSGIDTSHEDLQGSIADGGYDFYDNSSDISDDNGHGTNVSGIISAQYNNYKGIAGIDSKIGVKILPLKTADSNGDTLLSDLISAIDYAIDKKIDIINLSMGSNEYSSIENGEIQKAINSGIVVVAAAGNDGNTSYTYPASYDNVISVGATDQNNNKASFSNYNDRVSLSAPGVNILTTDRSGGYAYADGTSFSTPMVSSVAALLKSVRPDLSPASIKNTLQNNALDLGEVGKDNDFGYGEVDAYKSLTSVLAPQSIQINQHNLNINVSGTSKLTAVISPDNVIDKNVIWTSSDSSVASVDQSGEVKGIALGSVTITARTEQGNVTDTASVDVTNSNVIGVAYDSHVENIGWQNYKYNGETAGTTGQGLRVEALKVNLENAPEGARVKYQVHVQNIGWQDYVYDGALAGTTGQGLRIEALRIVLENAPGYSIAYQVHVQNIGWQDYVYDGALSGTTGKGLRIEALRVKIVKKH